jgi:hypothetical protein
MIYYWSQAEEAFRGTLVHTAERRDNRRIGKLYGFEYIPEISEKAHRSALMELAYSRRGTRATMARAVECALSDGNQVFDLIIHMNYGDRLFSTDSLDPKIWSQRYIRTKWGVHFVQRIQTNQNVPGVGNNCTILHISKIDTVYYTRLPKYKGAIVNNINRPSAYITVWLLPFVIQEKTPSPLNDYGTVYHAGSPCEVDILLFRDWRQTVPPTYLRTDGNSPESDATPGGHILENVGVDGAPEGGTGGHPVYLLDNEVFPQLTKQLSRMLPPGSKLSIRYIRR